MLRRCRGDVSCRHGERVLTRPASVCDIFDPGYVTDPVPAWESLRESACPLGYSPDHGGAWLAVRHGDVVDIVKDPARFSSSSIGVIPPPPGHEEAVPMGFPPLTADPPLHGPARRPLQAWLSPRRASQYEASTRELAKQLIERYVSAGGGDAVAGYASRIPIHVISLLLGVPGDDADRFRKWVDTVFRAVGDPEARVAARDSILAYFNQQIAMRSFEPGSDLISALVHMSVDGAPLRHAQVLGTVALLLIAGVDTTAAAIASSLWHLATHPKDRARLVAEPQLLDTAVEEFLRAYAPVTMARIATQDLELAGCPIREGDRVLVSFPAANRDPAAFPHGEKVRIDRTDNRHLAFGLGIHRCLGSHLARMQLRVALSEWLGHVPEFHLDPAAVIEWTAGQVRGPRSLPIVIGEHPRRCSAAAVAMP